MEGINQAIHEGGMQYGSSTAVFHASRTDIDSDDEVPSARTSKMTSLLFPDHGRSSTRDGSYTA